MDMKSIKEEIESWLKHYFEKRNSYNKMLYEAMNYSLTIGGKRIRPILLILTYNLYKENYMEVLPVACAVEMIHTYSLIHDDLPCMDDDDLRRGKPANHKVFGEAAAVLAGDALLNEAMNIMFDYCTKNNFPAVRACSVISKASGAEGMIGGQIVDILSEGKKISKEELEYIHSKKTGELIKAPIIAGAILGNAPENEISALENYGEKLGLAFQIKDDILDEIGDTKVLGKNVHSDSGQNKSTFVSIFGIDFCKNMCISLTEECMSILHELHRDTSSLEDLTMFLLKREF